MNTSNPIYARLTRGARPPSLRATFWIAFGLGLAALAWAVLTALPLLHQADVLPLVRMGAWTSWNYAIVLVTPLMTAITAATITSRDTASEDFALLRATPLPPATVVRGYLGAALFRLRLVFAALVVLMPLVAVCTFVLRVGMYSFASTYTAIIQSNLIPGVPLDDLLLQFELTGPGSALCTSIGGFGLAVLGAAFGVWAGLRWRRPAAWSLVMPLATLPIMFAALWEPLGVATWLVFAILPWLLIVPVLRLAARAYDRGRVS